MRPQQILSFCLLFLVFLGKCNCHPSTQFLPESEDEDLLDEEVDTPMEIPLPYCNLTAPCTVGSTCTRRCLVYQHLKGQLDATTLQKWFQLSEFELEAKVKQWIDSREQEDEKIEQMIDTESSNVMVASEAERRYNQLMTLFVLLSLLMLIIVPFSALVIVCHLILGPLPERPRLQRKGPPLSAALSPPSPWELCKLVGDLFHKKYQQRTECNLEFGAIAL